MRAFGIFVVCVFVLARRALFFFEKRLFLPPDKAGIFRGAWLLAIFSVGFLLPQQAEEAGVSVLPDFAFFCALARGGREVFGRCLFAFSFLQVRGARGVDVLC